MWSVVSVMSHHHLSRVLVTKSVGIITLLNTSSTSHSTGVALLRVIHLSVHLLTVLTLSIIPVQGLMVVQISNMMNLPWILMNISMMMLSLVSWFVIVVLLLVSRHG